MLNESLHIVKGILPWPEPIRRRRIRQQANSLVSNSNWLGDDASHVDVAELSLLRCLWLQKHIHRATRWRQWEAAAVLARCSVETSLVGLYCLKVPEALERINKSNAKSVLRLLEYLPAEYILAVGLKKHVTDVIGDPKSLPNIKEMMETLSKDSEWIIPKALYFDFYVQLSTLFVHANGITFLRHVNNNNIVLPCPLFPWTKRGALHVGNGCTGLLAAAIAKERGNGTQEFEQYALNHFQQVLTPILVWVLKDLFSKKGTNKIKWFQVPNAIRVLIKTLKYVRANQTLSKNSEVRTEYIKEAITDIFGAFEFDIPEHVKESFIDELARHIELSIPRVTGSVS